MKVNAPIGLKTAASFTLLAVIFALSGCGNPTLSRARASGTVSYQSTPLKGGTISFVSDSGQVGTGTIDEKGHYLIIHVPVGEVKVTIETRSLLKGGVLGAQASPKEYKGSLAPRSTEGASARYVAIPPKYESIETTDLNRTVKKGDNQFDFELEGAVTPEGVNPAIVTPTP